MRCILGMNSEKLMLSAQNSWPPDRNSIKASGLSSTRNWKNKPKKNKKNNNNMHFNFNSFFFFFLKSQNDNYANLQWNDNHSKEKHHIQANTNVC